VRKHRRRVAESTVGVGSSLTMGPMDRHVARAFSPRMKREFEDDLLEALLFSSLPFNVLESPVSRGLFTKWVSGLDSLPTRRGMSTVVLQRKQDEVLSVLKKRLRKTEGGLGVLDSQPHHARTRQELRDC